MSISLDATIDQAQAAFDNGDYRSVVESCTHIIDQYPHYTAAQRLLGQAYLEQGQTNEAEAWFGRLLVHDPRNPSAYLGLGLIAEDRGVLDHALAYCQVAWELAPYDESFRNPINRVAEKRYGNDGRLRLTHAALAEIHANASRLRRAIKEYQSALIALPDRIDLWMGLAEALWQLGENADAAEIAREFLKDYSDLVPALIILADVEQRTGNQDAAIEHRTRLRRLDPDGTLAAAMVAKNPHADAAFLLVKPDERPQLAEKTETVVSERPQYAPAPDFTYMPETGALTAEVDIESLQPISLEEFDDDVATMPDIPDDPETSSFVPEALDEPEEEPDTVEVEPLEEVGADDSIDQEPEEIESESAPSLNLLDMDLDDTPPPFTDESVDDAELAGLIDGLDDIEPMSLDDFGAADGVMEVDAPGFFEDSEIDFDIKIEDPDAVQIGGGPPKVTPGILGIGGDASPSANLDDEFPELPEVDEPGAEAPSAPDQEATVVLELDESESIETDQPEPDPQPEPSAPAVASEALPSIQQGSGFTRLLGEIGSEGLAPFDPTRTAADPAPATAEESGDGRQLASSLADGWDDIDDELASAIPGGSDELLDIDDLGLVPFTLDDEDIDLVTSVEPAGFNPPSAEEASAVDTDKILEPDVAAVDKPAEFAEPEPETQADSPDEGEIESFAIEELDDIDSSTSFEFGVLPWEQKDGEAGLDVQELLAEVTDAAVGSPSPFDLEDPEDEDSHGAITRKLGDPTVDPQFAQRMAEVEEAARQNLDRVHRDQNREPEPSPRVEHDAREAVSPDDPDTYVSTRSADHLVNDPALFERVRAAKGDLIEKGAIRGDRKFASTAPVGEDAPPAVPEPAVPVETPVAEPVREDQDLEALEALKTAVENNPRDDEAHWQYGEALRAQGHTHAAFTEYRWLIRHAPGRHNAIIASLEHCVLHFQEEDLAHRLLADIYRRRGDSAQARKHASMAMATRRLKRGISM